MTTTGKLWLGFGTLILLLVISGVAIIVRVWSVEREVKEMSDARDRLSAANQLETNIFGYALAIRTYLQTREPTARTDAAKEAEKAEWNLSDYKNRAITDRQREMAERFLPMWLEFRELGASMLYSGDRLPTQEDSTRLYDLRSRLEILLDEEMQTEAAASYVAYRQEAMLDIKRIVLFILVLLIAAAVIALITSLLVGRGVINAEFALQQAHDELENRVRNRTAQLATANEDLERSNRELEQFASVASHDLQEPLRKIQAFGDRLSSKFGDQLTDQGLDYMERILASAARMRTLIDDLLSFSRVATKAQPFVSTDLGMVAREVVADLEGRMEQTGGTVELNGLPTIDADPLQMRQMLQNLIGNGLKFHRTTTPPVVKVRSRRSSGPNGKGQPDQFCEIIVEDNGIGFEEVYLDRIFELFQRLHGRNEYEGTGMGLAICRKIVERHGGEITAKSKPGQGATFFVTLPVRQQIEVKSTYE